MFFPKAILLDLGGVVFQSTGQSNEVINWAVISDLNHRFGYELNIGADVFTDFMREYNLRTGQELGGSDFLAAVFDTLSFNQELVDFLGQIATIIIVSDNYRENISYISKRYHFEEWASRQFYSFDFGLVKADPKFFDRLLARLPYEATSLLFIDDSQDKLDSAAQFGIEGILFQDNHRTMQEVNRIVGPR